MTETSALQMTRNILKTFRRADDSQFNQGMTWYQSAHNAAWVLGRGDVWKGAGVIAAYSPLTPWWRNMELAIDSLNRGEARTDSLKNSVAAATRILNGEHPLDVFGGLKTRAFASNIALNGESNLVTVDSHAYSVAHNRHTYSKDVKMGVRMYRQIEDAYRRAAKREGLFPNQMQAVAWVVWRDENINKAARKDIP